MLWSQYKLATIRGSEFLCKQITGISNIASQNPNFLTLQTSEFQKKSDRNLWNQKQNWNSAYDGGPRNRNQKSEFPNKDATNDNHQLAVFIKAQHIQVSIR
jgi:hypothetical protein